VCQLDTLGKCCNRAMLRKSLATLPRTLDQTYDRILTSIGEEYLEYAMRILQWLAFSARPLSVEEVAEVVAIDVARDPAFDGDEVLEDPLEALNICSSLVTITTNEVDRRPGSAQRIVALAHYSVQEYLVSDRIRQGSAKQYSMQEAECQSAITRGCLKYLMQLPQLLEREILQGFALARYSAEFWSSHLRKTGDRGEQASQLAACLMAKEKPAYLTWIRLHDPDSAWEGPNFEKSLDSMPMPLYYAAMLGFSIITGLLLDKGAEVNAQGGDYGNALQAASIGSYEQIVRTLLNAGAEVNAQGGDYGNALQAASIGGYEQIVRTLLDAGAEVNAQGGEYGNALQAALARGHEQTVKTLLNAGAEVNAQGGDYGNALQAASARGHEQIVRTLLNAGAEVNAQSGRYSSALQAASARGHEQTIKMLLDAGAEVNAQGGDYGSALQAASVTGHKQIVKMLLDAGAEVDAQGGHYGSALQAASIGGHEQIVRTLLDAGAEVDAQGGHYGSALQAASIGGHEQIVRTLLNAGAEVNAQGGDYGNALSAAAYGGHEEVLELLISNCSISRVQDYYGRTLLWWAAAGGNIATVEILMNQHDIDSQEADRYGRKPSWIARKKGYGAVAILLDGWGEETDKEQEASPRVSNNPPRLECDVCTSSIPTIARHYHCNLCNSGDWDVCEDCRNMGATCMEAAHTLVERTMLDGTWVDVTS
jgi:ankyrin repeat protein